MSVKSHLSTLITRHNLLEEEIRQAYFHRLPADEITLLKKRKLKVKEEIELLKISQESGDKVAA